MTKKILIIAGILLLLAVVYCIGNGTITVSRKKLTAPPAGNPPAGTPAGIAEGEPNGTVNA